MYDEYPEDQPEEIEIEAIGIEVSTQPIELFKVFKIANIVGSGGEAKHIISEGYVAVNGELETRKRRKLYDGDLIEFNQEYYVILCNEAAEESTAPQYDMDESIHEGHSQEVPEELIAPESEVQEPEMPEEKKPSKGRKSIQFF